MSAMSRGWLEGEGTKSAPVTEDEVVQPRKMYIATLKDAKDLVGKTVWVQSGYALDYYPFAAGRVEFAHPAGVLPSVQQLTIGQIMTEKAPANLAMRVPIGDKQVFAVFKMPGDAEGIRDGDRHDQGNGRDVLRRPDVLLRRSAPAI